MIRTGRHLPSCDVFVKKSTHQYLIGSLGLVQWYAVTCVVDAREGEMSVLPNCASHEGIVDMDVGVACCGERGRRRMVDGKGSQLAAIPLMMSVSESSIHVFHSTIV